MRKPRALLIDLDDTLVAYSSPTVPAWTQACEEFYLETGFTDPESLRGAIHEKSSWYWQDPERHRLGRLDLRETRRRIVAAALAPPTEHAEPAIYRRPSVEASLASRLADRFSALREELIFPFPGAIEALDAIRARGDIVLVMVTNGQSCMQRAKIDRFDLARRFDHIIVEGEFGRGKPDPAIFARALSLAGAPPERAWMVGDNLEWDIAGALDLGITAIWNDFSGRLHPPEGSATPDARVGSFPELLGLLDRAI